MAKKNLTLEEKLEEAIAKDEPYEVPKNWGWIEIGSVIEIVSGGTPKSNVSDYYENGDVAWITPVDLSGYNDIYISRGRRNITKLGLEKSSARLMPKDSVLMSSRAPIGYVVIAENEISTNQGFKSFLPSPVYLPKYLYFYLKYSKDLIETYASGTTFLEISGAKTKLIPFPTAPLKEQQRIVDKIESLFEKLDRSKELIEEAREGFEKRKGSITSKVFRGKLNQRDGKLDIKIDSVNSELYKIPDNWRWVKLRDVCEKITDGTHNSPQSYENGEYKYVTAKNIKEWGVDLSNITYLTKEDHDVIYKRCNVKYGDVLYIKDGATAGIATINKILSSVALLRVNKHIINKYLYYLLNSFEIKKIIFESVKGVAITRLTLKKINDIIIPLPPIDEQKEIVRILDKLLEEEDKIDELTQLEGQIGLIKKSILAKAFRGELGTNCEEDESALELLKKILMKE